MSDETSTKSDGAEACSRMWADFASKVAAASLSFAPSASPPEAAGQVRNALFGAAEQYWTEFMRSPEFLEAMKQAMDGAIAFRKQLNEVLTRAHHEAQGVAREDIDSVMLCIRHMETRILDRIDEVASRLDRISERLEALEGQRVPKAPPSEAAPVREARLPERPRRKNTKK